MPPFLPPFLLGLIVTPLAKRFVRPLVHGAVKTSVALAMEVKKAAYQAGEEFHDLAAEASAEMINAELRSDAKAGTKIDTNSVAPRTTARAGDKRR